MSCKAQCLPMRVQNKIAIIGVTALGLADVVSTPVAAHMDGVEVQAAGAGKHPQ